MPLSTAGETHMLRAGEHLFHCSKWPEELVASGAFDPERAPSWGGGMFFTLQPIPKTNCVVAIDEDLTMYERFAVTDQVHGDRVAEGRLVQRSLRDLLARRAAPKMPAFDGWVRSTNRDPGTMLADGTHVPELLVFPRCLGKLGAISALTPPN